MERQRHSPASVHFYVGYWLLAVAEVVAEVLVEVMVAAMAEAEVGTGFVTQAVTQKSISNAFFV